MILNAYLIAVIMFFDIFPQVEHILENCMKVLQM